MSQCPVFSVLCPMSKLCRDKRKDGLGVGPGGVQMLLSFGREPITWDFAMRCDSSRYYLESRHCGIKPTPQIKRNFTAITEPRLRISWQRSHLCGRGRGWYLCVREIQLSALPNSRIWSVSSNCRSRCKSTNGQTPGRLEMVEVWDTVCSGRYVTKRL